MRPSRVITVAGQSDVQLSCDGRMMVVTIPVSLRHVKGRKRMMTSGGVTLETYVISPKPVDRTVVKAIVRAHRWRSMLEARLFTSVRDLAQAEKINESYLCRMLRLTLLSPAIIESILDGSQHESLELSDLLDKLPSEWDAQAAYIACLH